ncbi:MAG: hypothetical protein RBQ91_07300 [Acholeplasma sp.]|nr:hypothetical protein [Acholeplasma sp.]
MKGITVKKYTQLMLVLGFAALLVFSIDLIHPFLNDYMRGFFMSFGLSIIFVSLVFQNNKKYMAKSELEAKDERMIMIRQKQYSTGYYFHLFLTVLGIIGFGFFEETQVVSTILSGFILIETIAIGIFGTIYMKKY